MLSFIPEYHTKIDSGDFAGNWTPTYFGIPETLDHAKLRFAEADRIKSEGEKIVYFNPKSSDSDTEKQMRELMQFMAAELKPTAQDEYHKAGAPGGLLNFDVRSGKITG